MSFCLLNYKNKNIYKFSRSDTFTSHIINKTNNYKWRGTDVVSVVSHLPHMSVYLSVCLCTYTNIHTQITYIELTIIIINNNTIINIIIIITPNNNQTNSPIALRNRTKSLASSHLHCSNAESSNRVACYTTDQTLNKYTEKYLIYLTYCLHFSFGFSITRIWNYRSKNLTFLQGKIPFSFALSIYWPIA